MGKCDHPTGGFARRWSVRNKPNLPEPVRVTSAFERKGYGSFRWSVDREKQSQFPAGGTGAVGCSTNKANWPGLIVQNEPNFPAAPGALPRL